MIFYDFEVFEKDWLAVFIDVTKKKEHVIINSPDKLKALYEANRKDIWVGFNNRHYDQYIMKGILLGMNPKKINDWIIVDNKEGWQYSRAFNKLPIQSNTDGLIIWIPDTDEAFEMVDDICWEWEQRCSTEQCSILLELDNISEIYQKDVNNYLWIGTDGGVERIGAYVKELSAIDNDLPMTYMKVNLQPLLITWNSHISTVTLACSMICKVQVYRL